MTNITSKNSTLLSKVGITIGKSNKLELDEDALKQADISTLKTLFSGYNSYASQISDKASSIVSAAASAGGTYTSSGTYNSAVSSVVSAKVDTKS